MTTALRRVAPVSAPVWPGQAQSAPLSGLVPSVAAGNTVSPPSSTSDLRASREFRRARCKANGGGSQIQQHRCNALPAVLRIQLVVKVVEMGLPSMERQRLHTAAGFGPRAHLVFLPNVVVKDLDAFTVVCKRSA